MSKLKPTYNCEKLYIWPMIDEENELYGSPIILTKKLMTYDDSTANNTTDLYGDGVVTDTAVDEGAGTLALGIHGLTDEEYAIIYGVNIVNGAVVETGEEVPPYCCVALMARRGKNIVTLRKWPKVRFAKHTESVQQKQGNTTYSTPTLSGTFVLCERLNAKRVRRTVDLSTQAGASLARLWFEDPDIIAPGLANTSYLAATSDGDPITVFTDLTTGTLYLKGSAEAGTSPYKYYFAYRRRGNPGWTDVGDSDYTTTASQTVSLASEKTYEIKISVKDGADVVVDKLFTVTTAAQS